MKYLNLDTFSEDLLAMFVLWFCCLGEETYAIFFVCLVPN